MLLKYCSTNPKDLLSEDLIYSKTKLDDQKMKTIAISIAVVVVVVII